MVYTKKEANAKIKAILKDFSETYSFLAKQSRTEYMNSLPPGSFIPAENRLYTESAKKLFSDKCDSLRAEAKEILGQFLKDYKKKSTDAPSNEAVNVISLLATRNDITREEIEDLLERYGDNPQSFRAIVSIANEKGIKSFDACPIDAELQRIDDLSASLGKMLSPYGAQNGKHVSEGFIAFYYPQIDEAFPEE